MRTKPFPSLTPAQRLHIENYGYVIVKDVLTRSEVEALKDALYGIEKDFRRTGELPGPNCFNTSTTEEFFHIDNLLHLSTWFFDYVTHPRIVDMAEESIGGSERLQQPDAHIRCPAPDRQRFGFHRGINPGYNHYDRGLYHFSFIKALTNLTDLGPDDGSTAVIVGAHKVLTDIPDQAIANAALEGSLHDSLG